MGPRRRLIAGLAVFAVGMAGWLAAPRRFAVEGVSMGPGLLPGDVVRSGWFPACDRLRRPRRFDRWVVAATDGLAIKRVAGLPGEELTIADGDLMIDGTVVLKEPRQLAEAGSVVADPGGPPAVDPRRWERRADELLDDAEFDPGPNRRLTAVHDAGLVALIDVRTANASHPVTVRVRVGDTEIVRPLVTPGRHALVAGRLDGHLVVAAWPVPAAAAPHGSRTCLPAGGPASWSVADPWPAATAADDLAPALAIDVGGDDRARLAAVSRWRDAAYRAAANGRSRWRLSATECFLLGDHPPASTDSRHWGPVPTAALRQRIVGRVGE